MTLPTSESIPDNFNDLSPAQKRRIRHSLRGASESELKSLLLELQRRSTPAYEFFLLSLLGAILAGMALVINSPLLLAAAAICVPILTPMMGVAISPALRSLPFLLQSLASLLISIIFHFGFGALAGVVATEMGRPIWQNIPVVNYTHWIGWVVLLITALLAGFLFLRYEVNPRMAGVMISYLVFIPISSSGFLLAQSDNALWSELLLSGFTFLMAAIFVTTLIFLILGLFPKKTLGWLIFLIAPTAIVLMLVFGGGTITAALNQPDPVITEAPCPVVTCEADTEAPVCILPDLSTSTQAKIATSTPTLVKTATLTPIPTPAWGRVDSENGAVIREGPGFENPIVAYASDGDLLQILPETFLNGNTLWVKVIAEDQTEGWILASLLVTPQP